MVLHWSGVTISRTFLRVGTCAFALGEGILTPCIGFVLINFAVYTMCRYADDFVIMCASKKEAEDLYSILADYLTVRGLTLSEEKTNITHVKDGFDFLGFNIRSYLFN